MTSYETRFVAFVDVLGFKELVLQSVNEDKIFIQIINSIYNPEATEKISRPNNVNISNFSDSFILSCTESLNHFSDLVYLVNILYLNMITNGTLCRGGISLGSMYHCESMAFGPAFLDAYRLENVVARYPRIVLGKSALERIRELFASESGEDPHVLRKWFRRDEDGVIYMDQFAEFYSGFSDQDPDEGTLYAAKSKEIGRHLSKMTSETTENPSVFEKYKWMVNEFNRMVSKNKIHKKSLKHIDVYNTMSDNGGIKGPQDF